MLQSLSKVIIHIVSSTKNREPWLDSAIRPRMHAYLATICRDLGGEALSVGGVADHVHVVTTLARTLSQACRAVKRQLLWGAVTAATWRPRKLSGSLTFSSLDIAARAPQ